MKRQLSYRLILICVALTLGPLVYGQETVFGLFLNDERLGDKFFKEKNFQGALKLYSGVSKKNKDIQLKIARCYYSLKDYPRSISYYDSYIKTKRNLPWSDVYYYAEVQAATGNYKTAIEYYQKHLSYKPDDELALKKVWRLSNVQYLYDDSSHYAVRPVSFNTEYGELCAVQHGNQVVFMSNRKEPELIEKVNASINAPFYRIYSSRVLPGETSSGGHQYTKATPFKFFARFGT